MACERGRVGTGSDSLAGIENLHHAVQWRKQNMVRASAAAGSCKHWECGGRGRQEKACQSLVEAVH